MKKVGKTATPFRYDLYQIPYDYTVEVRNRFKGLDLIDRGDRDQDHPHGKEMQKSKMAVWGGLTNSCERRQVKSKGEKERYKHLNAEFQRIARKDMKAFFSDQSKEIEENLLECEVKWALESIIMNKASGGDGIPVELFQILEDDAVKVLLSICQQIWKTQQWPQDWKISVFIPVPKAIPKNAQTTTQLHSSHMLVNNAQNSASEASTVCEPRTSRCSSWI